MWSIVSLCLLATLTAADSGWDSNVEYQYKVQGKTLAGLHEISNDYSGILYKADLRIQPRADGKLRAELTKAEYAEVLQKLEKNWNSPLSEEPAWQRLEISSKPFEMQLEDGEITALIVSEDVPQWESNMIKGIVSQFQMKISHRAKSHKHHDEQGLLSSYFVMEDTVTGETETHYKINSLPQHFVDLYPNSDEILQNSHGKIYEVTKQKNYTLSSQLPTYYYGFGGLQYGIPGTNKMGSFVSRSSLSRAVLTGDLSKPTIQNSFTVNEILVNPTVSDNQKGSVYSMVNVTLENTEESRQKIDEVPNPIRFNSLVFTHENFLEGNAVDDDSQEQPYYSPKNSIARRAASEHEAEGEKQLEQGLHYMYNGQAQLAEEVRQKLIQEVKKLAKEIAKNIQNYNSIPETGTMDKLTQFNSFVRILSANDLKNIGEELYSSQQATDRDAWKVYRDSVAVSGGAPALLVIKDWISSGKVSGFEAATLVSGIAKTARQPYPQYMRTFFDLVQATQVRSQWPLNSTAILSYSRLIRKVYVQQHQQQQRNQYSPQSVHKLRVAKGLYFVKKTVIPYFANELHSAISRADNRQIHVYIRVLGNIGHPNIISAFKPYLEGEKQASQYQRTLMVLAMDKVAQDYPEQVRPVLVRLYQNIGEEEQVRAAAVYQIMRTEPSTELLQHMASYTNVDPHHHVSAAVKSAIESAANADGEEFTDIREAAQAAQPLLTDEEFGIQQGAGYLRHHVVEQMQIHFQEQAEVIGSHDQFYPKGLRYSEKYNFGGIRHDVLNLEVMVSSIDELINVFQKETQHFSEQYRNQEQNAESQRQHPYSSIKIAQELGIEPDEREQLEGSLYLEYGLLQAMLSVDNHTISNLHQTLKKWEQNLNNGEQINFLKYQNDRKMHLEFPTETGFPFIYTYDTPSLIRVHGFLKAVASPKVAQDKLQQPETIQVRSDLSFTAVSKIQGRISFIAPFNKQRYIAGYDKNVQVHIPLKGKIDWKSNNFYLELEKESFTPETRWFHYSTWPYVARVNTKDTRPVSEQQIQYIKQDNLRAFNQVFGENQGIAVKVHVEHERQLQDISYLQHLLSSHGVKTALKGLWDDSNIQYSQVNLVHLENKSKTDKVILRLTSKEEYKPQGSNAQSEQFKNHENPEVRQNNAMEIVAANIKNARTSAYDLTVSFKGDETREYSLTTAYAKSNEDPKSRIFATYRRKQNSNNKPFAITFEADSHIENTNGLDATFALDNDPKMSSEMKLSYHPASGEPSKVKASWDFDRTAQREEYLRSQPGFNKCTGQSPSCLNMTMEAGLFDRIKATVQYENIPKELQDALQALYYSVRYNYFPSTEVDKDQKSSSSNEVVIQGLFDPDLLSVNVSIKNPEEQLSVQNVPLNEWAKRVLVPHPVFHVGSRLFAQSLALDAYRPSCTVDVKQITTFHDKMYPGDISDKWTVMFQYVPKIARHEGEQPVDVQEQLKHQPENYAVLVKSNAMVKNKDVKITFSTPETDYQVVEISLYPTSKGSPIRPKVEIDGKQVENQQPLFNGFVEMYDLPNNELKVELKDQFYVLYDGEEIRVSALNGKFRESTRGLCGQFTDNKYDDFITPGNCVARNHKKFIRSYEVIGAHGKQTREELKNDRQQCIRIKEPTYVSISPDDKKENESCMKAITRYVRRNNEICFSLRPMPQCTNGCTVESTTRKEVAVHCLPVSVVTQMWQDQIDNGISPDFSRKPESRKESLEIPDKCSL